MIPDDDLHPMATVDGVDLPDDPRIAEVVADYQRELEAGRNPDRERFVNRYPELAAAVKECIDGLQFLLRGFRDGLGDHGHSDQQPPAERWANPLGDFQIVRELARGGMGVVYEAVQLSLDRRVALKVLPFAATFDGRQLQRFKNEAQAAALLHHTHIVPIYAVGCERGVHFYAMQLIEGQSLAVLIQQLRKQVYGRGKRFNPPSSRNTAVDSDGSDDQTAPWLRSEQESTELGTFPVTVDAGHSPQDVTATLTATSPVNSEAYFRRIAQLMAQAAEALEHAHQIGVVHRDIKPANLLIDNHGQLWVTDFGLAQLQTDHGLTRTGDLLGTLRYMSPEQAGGQRSAIDHRTDIYSLGATFYELLALEPLFAGKSQHDILSRILHDEPKALGAWNRAVPSELETIILKALNKHPTDRYPTAADLAADLERFLSHLPIRARRPSVIDRTRKWARRHPSIVIAGVLLLLVISIASLLSAQLIAREQFKTAEALEREKVRANEAEQRFKQARQAVDALFQISEQELSARPMDAARKRVLEIVLDYYQDFIEQRQGDPTSQAELSAVKAKVQGIIRELEILQRDMHTRLLTSDAVQAELGLSAEQRQEINSLLDAWSKARYTLFEGTSAMSEEARRKHMVTEAEEHERELATALTSSQLHRFKQLSIQSLGALAFKEPEVVNQLQLTPEQQTRIREIERATFAKRFFHHGPSRRPGSGSPDSDAEDARRERARPSPRAMFQVDHEEAEQQVLLLLNTQQLQRWHELIGAPFTDFGDERFPGPPGGPPRP